jgi:hypothetical protein
MTRHKEKIIEVETLKDKVWRFIKIPLNILMFFGFIFFMVWLGVFGFIGLISGFFFSALVKYRSDYYFLIPSILVLGLMFINFKALWGFIIGGSFLLYILNNPKSFLNVMLEFFVDYLDGKN